MSRSMFSLTTMVLFLSAAGSVFAQDRAAAPVFQEGDSWQFRVIETGLKAQIKMDGNYQVVYSGGKVKVKQQGGEKTEGKRGGELLRILGFGDDNGEYLQFPLVVGKKWKTSDQHDDRFGRQVDRRVESTVTGVEQIVVAGG